LPRQNPGPRLQLYGPDTRYGAKRRKGFTEYVWYIVWREDGQKRERSTGSSRESIGEAENALWAFLDNRIDTWRGTRNPDQVAVADVLAIYAEQHAPNTSDPKRILYASAALGAWWGEQPLSAVTANTCRAYARERGASPGTVRRELAVLRAAIRYCWREGKLTHEMPVTLPPKTPARDLWLTRREAAFLLRGARMEKASGHLPYFILFGLYTGHRKRAIVELQWQANTLAGHIDIPQGIIDFQGRRAPTKKRRSRIPVPPPLKIFVPYLRKRTRQYVLEWQGERLLNVKRSFATACRNAAWLAIAAGKKYRRGHPERRALAASARKFRQATPHTLRHTCTTWLVAKGLPFADVGGWVGMSVEMVERTYGHHSPAQHQRVLGAFTVGRRR
jgi:integrase